MKLEYQNAKIYLKQENVDSKYSYAGEFGKVKDALINISESMIDVMQNIHTSAEQVNAGSDDLAKAAQRPSKVTVIKSCFYAGLAVFIMMLKDILT